MLNQPFFYQIDGWAHQLRKGVLENGVASRTEDTQRVSFEFATVDGDWGDLYATGPTLLQNGTLHFTVNPTRFGNTLLTLTMFDDGGTEFYGRNATTRTIQINIQPKSSALFSTGILPFCI